MKKLKNFSAKLFKNNSGQGATEYILLLVVIVGLVVMFGPKIKAAFSGKVDEVTGNISNFGSN
jgi:hypothetical protein